MHEAFNKRLYDFSSVLFVQFPESVITHALDVVAEDESCFFLRGRRVFAEAHDAIEDGVIRYLGVVGDDQVWKAE